MVWLGYQTLAGLLRLPEGQRVSSIHADWLRLGIGVVVEGGDLPEVAENEYPGSVPPAGYVDLELRAKLEAFVQRYHPERTMGLEELAIMSRLRDILVGTLDPQVDMSEELKP